MNTDAKTEVIQRLLNMSRLIRRRGTPQEAVEAAPYEMQLQKDLEARQKELADQQEPPAHDKAA